MRSKGHREGTQPGDVVQYVICKDTADGSVAAPSGSSALAARAYHPLEVLENTALQVDVHYYLSHQLHPVMSRLCAPLDTTSDAHLAECLGLDPTKFRSRAPVAETIAVVRSHDILLSQQHSC
jgi:DNA polymerase alpha subunit A